MVRCNRENVTKMVNVSEKDTGDQVKWKLKIKVINPKYLREQVKVKKKIIKTISQFCQNIKS